MGIPASVIVLSSLLMSGLPEQSVGAEHLLPVARSAGISAVDLQLVSVTPEGDDFHLVSWLCSREKAAGGQSFGSSAGSNTHSIINVMLTKADSESRDLVLKNLFIADGLLALRDADVARHAGVHHSASEKITNVYNQFIHRRNALTGLAAFSTFEKVLPALLCLQIQAELDCIRVLTVEDLKAITPVLSRIRAEDAIDFHNWLQANIRRMNPAFWPDELFEEAAVFRRSLRLANRVQLYTIGVAILLNAHGDRSTWNSAWQMAQEGVCGGLADRLVDQAEIRAFISNMSFNLKELNSVDILNPQSLFQNDSWMRMQEKAQCRMAIMLLCTPQSSQFIGHPSISRQFGWSGSERDSQMQLCRSVDIKLDQIKRGFLFDAISAGAPVSINDQAMLGVYLVNTWSLPNTDRKIELLLREHTAIFERAWGLPL